MTAHLDEPVCLLSLPAGPASPAAGGWVPLDRYAARFWLPVLGATAWSLWCALIAYTVGADEAARPVWRGLRALARAVGCDWRTLVGRDRGGRHYAGAVEVLERWELLRVGIQPGGARLWWVTRHPPLLPEAAVAELPEPLREEHARWLGQHPEESPSTSAGEAEAESEPEPLPRVPRVPSGPRASRAPRSAPRPAPREPRGWSWGRTDRGGDAPGVSGVSGVSGGVGPSLHPVGKALQGVGTAPPKETYTRPQERGPGPVPRSRAPESAVTAAPAANTTAATAAAEPDEAAVQRRRLLQRWHLVTETARLPEELKHRAREQLHPLGVVLDEPGDEHAPPRLRLVVRAWSHGEAARWQPHVPRLSAALAELTGQPRAAVAVVGPEHDIP